MKLSIGGEAQKYQCVHGGTYFLQENKTNNNYYWIHQSGDMAIWWSTIEQWIVGGFEDLGSSRGGILGPSNNDSPPNQITNGWQYATDKWTDTNDIHFEDLTFKQGKFLHFIYIQNSNKCLISKLSLSVKSTFSTNKKHSFSLNSFS